MSGTMAPGGTDEERKFSILRDLRESSSVSLEPHEVQRYLELLQRPELAISGLIIPARKEAEGLLIASVSDVWEAIVRELGDNWKLAFEIQPEKWEEIIAGAYTAAGFDHVILTPRSNDHGRDVIASKSGIGSVRILDSVKAYKPALMVGYDHIRAVLGVLSADLNASKAVISTTSGFPPNVMNDPFISKFIPYRLQLMDGPELQKWLKDLAAKKKSA
jgi:restriction system protein